MKRFCLIAVGSSIATLLCVAVALEINAQNDQLRADATLVIESTILHQPRKLLIHLPPGYESNSDKQYPVLFALDATSHDRDVLNVSSVLGLAGVASEVIIVGVVNVDRNADLTPDDIRIDEATSTKGNGNALLDFLEKEAVPRVESTCRTSGYKMISGNSRGGLFAFYAWLEKPDLFDACFSFSPALWRDGQMILEKAKHRFEQKQDRAGFLFVSMGENENEKMKAGFELLVGVLPQYEDSNVSTHYTKGADHGSNAILSLPLAFREWGATMQSGQQLPNKSD